LIDGKHACNGFLVVLYCTCTGKKEEESYYKFFFANKNVFNSGNNFQTCSGEPMTPEEMARKDRERQEKKLRLDMLDNAG
jgi:hypothetical protein